MKRNPGSGGKTTIHVKGATVAVVSRNGDEYISITDIARYKDERTDYLIQNWLRNRNTIEFLGVWEGINNTAFNPIEFDGIRNRAGLNSFVITTKLWIEKTSAIGLVASPGRYFAGRASPEAQRGSDPPNAIIRRQCGSAPNGKCEEGIQTTDLMIGPFVVTASRDLAEREGKVGERRDSRTSPPDTPCQHVSPRRNMASL